MNTPEPFGNYVLMDRVAIGGMAEIFRARRTNDPSGRDICIKRILPHYNEDESFINMFIDEASIAAKLQHGNIVQIYDFDTHEGCYYIAMELIDGRDLKQALETCSQRGTQFDPAMVMVITGALGRSLHYAHTKEVNGQPLNIVHRDVSPHNVMVSFTGDVKLTDFGIAKAASRITTTRAGTVKGKCAYMSPEQARGKTLDGRSDIFSVGILMYEMLTCRRLFTGDSDFDILTKVLKEDITPPSVYVPGLDPEIERICLKALERDRDLRYSSGAALDRDVQQWIAQKLGGDESRSGLGEFMQALFGRTNAPLPEFRASVPQDIREIADQKTAMFNRDNMNLPDEVPSAPSGALYEQEPRLVVGDGMDDDDGGFYDEKTAISESPFLMQQQAQAAQPAAHPGNVSTEAISRQEVLAQARNHPGHQSPPGHQNHPGHQNPPSYRPPAPQPNFAPPPDAGQQRNNMIAIALVLMGLFFFFLVLAGIGIVFFLKFKQNPAPAPPALVEVQPDPVVEKKPVKPAPPAEGKAHLTITTTPRGAEIFVNGLQKDLKPDENGAVTLESLPQGESLALKISAKGYKDFEDTVTLTTSLERRSYALVKADTIVEEKPEDEKPEDEKAGAEEENTGAEDSNVAGTDEKPDEKPEDAPQDKATPPTKPTVSDTQARQRREEARKRREESKKKRGTGTVSVNALPWAEIKIDGRSAGRTPLSKELTVGRHRIIFYNPDKKKRTTKTVTIKKGQTSKVFHRFP